MLLPAFGIKIRISFGLQVIKYACCKSAIKEWRLPMMELKLIREPEWRMNYFIRKGLIIGEVQIALNNLYEHIYWPPPTHSEIDKTHLHSCVSW